MNACAVSRLVVTFFAMGVLCGCDATVGPDRHESDEGEMVWVYATQFEEEDRVGVHYIRGRPRQLGEDVPADAVSQEQVRRLIEHPLRRSVEANEIVQRSDFLPASE